MHRYPSLTALFLIGLTIAALAPLSLPAQERENVMDMSLEDILNLQVTTASKSAERLSDAPGVISVVTRDELERFGATTLKDVLERVPGLISTVGFLSDRTLVAARGDQVKSNSGHVLLLINGRPARDVTGGLNSDLYENFPVNVIDKIEVIKGPGSVLYGSDAFSAVINVITVKAESNALSLTGLAGNRGAYGTSGDARLKVGDLSVVAAGRYYQKAKWEAAYNYIDYIWTQNLNNKLVDIPDKGPGAYLGLNYKGLSIMSAYSDWTTAFFTAGLTGTVQWKKSFNDLGYSLKVR
ncbi:MAG TPA: TonB-dependent receptor plug domain-containing protein, partial [bacterium]